MPPGERRCGVSVMTLALTFCFSLLSLFKVSMATHDFFFTNTNDIRKFNIEDQVGPRILYTDEDHPQALDINYCSGDLKIYWISLLDGRIRRGNPDGGGTIENVIIDNNIQPRGIVVDYLGDNIYFSQHTDSENMGKIEVATCDGMYRKVLKTGLDKAGPIALDITRGYLYYVDGLTIYRVDTNGRHKTYIDASIYDIIGLAIDTSLNQLYWSTAQGTKYKTPPDSDSTPLELDVDTNPHGLAADNGILYWTVLGNVSILIPGEIYMYMLNGSQGGPHQLLSNNDIRPLDISTSLRQMPTPLSGCNTPDKAGCNQFCFTIPSTAIIGATQTECGCITGVVIDPQSQLCSIVPSKFLLFGQVLTNDQSQISMVSLDTDRDIVVPVPFQVSGLGSYYVTYDHSLHMVYWNEVSPPAIKRADINSRDDPVNFITTDIRSVSGLAVDTFSRNIYWSDSILDRIEVASIRSPSPNGFEDRPVRKVLISNNIHQPQSLALDLDNGYMYWVDMDSSNHRIEQARLDGSERKQLFTGLQLMPTYLAVDPATGIIYWSDVDNDGEINTHYTVRNRLDGRGHPIDAFNIHGLAIIDSALYWSDGLQGTIGKATIDVNNTDLDTSNYVDHVTGIQGIVAVDTTHNEEGPCNVLHSFDCNHICVPVSDIDHVCVCSEGFELLDGSTTQCTEPLGYAVIAILMNDVQPAIDIYTRTIESGGDEQWNYHQLLVEVRVVSMAIHYFNNDTIDIYYISPEDQLIYKYRAIAPDMMVMSEEATPIITCCLATPQDLAVDWLGGNLYWTDSERGVIEVSRLDGMSRRILYSNLDQPTHLSLDVRRGRIFFTSKKSLAISYVDMNGLSNQITHLCNPDDDPCTIGSSLDIIEITSLTIEYDPSPSFKKDRLVWSYTHFYDDGNVIETVSGSYNLSDLSKAPRLVQDGGSDQFLHSSSLAFNGSLYYSVDNDGIFRHFSHVEHVIEDMTAFLDFEIAHTLAQPGFHECTASERCFGYDPLCLITDHIYGHCSCPIDAFKRIESDTNEIERDSCTKTFSFVMWATENNIYYYPLPSDLTDPATTSEPHIVPRCYHGDVVALTYDPKDENVLWLDGTTKLLHSVSIHGLKSEILGKFPDHVRPNYMSLDWIGGQILFTEESGYQIEAASVRNDREDRNLTIGSVVSSFLTENGVVSPYQPHNVLFDEQSLAVFWHEEGRQIFKSLLGQVRETNTPLLEYDITRSITYLTFDPNTGYLYWWNQLGNTIEGFNVIAMELNPRNTDVVTFVSDVDNVGGLTSNSLTKGEINTSLLFWFDELSEAFYFCNVTRRLGSDNDEYDCKEKQLDWSLGNGERLVAMTSFDQERVSRIATPYDCRKAESVHCDYLCIERGGRSECRCPLFRQSVGEDESECTDISCPSFHTSCEDDLECYPNTYACDGLEHCANGLDELNCTTCNEPGSILCGPGDMGQCYSNTSRCDDHLDCPVSYSDELICCGVFEFGCYSIIEDRYTCYQDELRCGPETICLDGSDQEGCGTVTNPTPSTDSPAPSHANITTIITVTIISVVTVFVLIVVLCLSYRFISKQKNRQRRFRFPTISKTSTSPPPISDHSSIYSAGMSSLGTESTHFGNCSSPHADPFCKMDTFHPERSTHISNPPPSLITARRQSQNLECEEEAQSFSPSFMPSEIDPCPAPNPSVDWENMSTQSFSASQRGVRSTMNTHGGENFNQNRRPLVLRGHHNHHNMHHPQAGNPLHHYHHHINNRDADGHIGFRGNTHIYHGNGHPATVGSITNNSVVSGNGGRRVEHYALSRFHGNARGTVGGRGYSGNHDDIPNYEEAETETVFSQSTIQTENGSHHVFPFEDRTPPGRPPSPATITEYSERVPHSPPPGYSDEEDEPAEGMEEDLHVHREQQV